MKLKTKYLALVIVLVAVIVCTVTFSVAFATILTLEYDYNTKVVMPQISYDGSTITSTGEVDVTVCDIIYRDGGKLKVQKNVELDGGYACNLDVVRVLPVTTQYTSENGTVTVNYKNEYVSSFQDIEKSNIHKAYNNVFEYFTTDRQSKSSVSRVLVLLDDITVEQDYTINYPCSVELLTSTLTLKGNLTIEHSYAGVYYVRGDLVDGNSVPQNGIVSENGSKLLISAPKAQYVCDDVLVESTNNSFSVDQLLNEALDFAAAQIPAYATHNLYLQSAYKTYGVSFTYEVKDKPAEGEELAENGDTFFGVVQNFVGTAKVVTVTAKYGEQQRSRNCEMNVVDFASGTFVEEGLAAAVEDYYFTNGAGNIQVTSFDFATVLNEFFSGEIPSGKKLMVFISDDSLLESDSEFATSLLDGHGHHTQLTLEGNIEDLLLKVHKGNLTLADNLSLYLVYDTTIPTEIPTQPSVTLALQKADYDDIIYYLKNITPAFLTNGEYGVLNLNEGKICAGAGFVSKVISTNDFGITAISGEFAGKDITTNEELTDSVIKDMYFGSMSANYTYTLKSKTVMLSVNHAIEFVYTVTFADGTERSFAIPVYRSALGAGGESEMFTSDNQLAAYFINEEMNWLAPYELVLTQGYCTKIEVVEINGVSIADLALNPIKNIVTLVGSGESRNVTDADRGLNDVPFYQAYKLLVNPNYVPAENTTVSVHCYLYNSESESENKMNEYSYMFIVPGILKCSANGYASVANWSNYDSSLITAYTFNDNEFYKLITQLLGGNYTSEVYKSQNSTETEQVILSSASGYEGNAKIDLDVVATENGNNYIGKGHAGYKVGTTYTAMDFSAVGSGKTISNMDGIQVFNRIQAVICDGITITHDIYAFSKYSGLTLKYISLQDCGLTDSCVYNADNGNVSALSNLYITAINISNNNLTRIDGLLMRTVQVLDISDNNIVNIDAISGLKDLIWLDISSNDILRFEPLKQLSSLKTAFVTDNCNGNSVYGSKGSINIPVYVWIMKTSGVEIFADQSAKTAAVQCGAGSIYGYSLSDEEIDGSVALNAFALPMVMNLTEKSRIESDLSTVVQGYTFKFVGKNGTVGTQMEFYTDTAVLNASTISEGTVCYYKVAIYSGTTLLAQREFCVTWG